MPKKDRRKQGADPRYFTKGIDKAKVIELHNDGLRNVDIARQLGCSQTRITRILQEAFGKGEKPPLDEGKVGALYRAGWTVPMIAEEMYCEEEEVSSVLNSYC